MEYILGQYNHKKEDLNDEWITSIIDTNEPNYSIVKINTVNSWQRNASHNIYDVGLRMKSGFELGKTYYCHCKIKTAAEDINQRITLKLINEQEYNQANNENIEQHEQYIKTIIIEGTEDGQEWVDVDFIFTPQGGQLDTILFYFNRTTSDYINEKQIAVAFLELSQINNIFTNKLMLKIGVQSRPGLRMAINREEIYVGRTGVYELKNKEIKINFISMIAQKEYDLTNEKLNENLTQDSGLLYGDYLKDPKYQSNQRVFESFTIDYIYETT